MAYIRKTEDEFHIMGDYGFGMECVNVETTWKDAKRSIREYRENEPGILFTIKKRRVRKEGTN
jgi:hypothetical protein